MCECVVCVSLVSPYRAWVRGYGVCMLVNVVSLVCVVCACVCVCVCVCGGGGGGGGGGGQNRTERKLGGG